MWSIETIRRMNREAGRKSISLVTRISSQDDIDLLGQEKSIEFIGDKCAEVDKQLDRVATLFVDSSGFGHPGEMALTQDGFKRRLTELLAEHGPLRTAVEERGQFQVYVAVWRAGR